MRVCMCVCCDLFYPCTVLAIELLAACQALEFRRPLKTTEPLEAVYNLVRTVVKYVRMYVCCVCIHMSPIHECALKRPLGTQDSRCDIFNSFTH